MSIEEKRQEALKNMREFCFANGIQNRDFREMRGYEDDDGCIVYPIVGRDDGTEFWEPGGKFFVGGYRVRMTL